MNYQERTMMDLKYFRRNFSVCMLAGSLALVGGCRSAADKANDAAVAQAKMTAAQTGAPQQVTWTDKDGNRTVVMVQPPAPGQTVQQVTTTVSRNQSSGGTMSQSSTTTTAMQPAAGVMTGSVGNGPAPVQGTYPQGQFAQGAPVQQQYATTPNQPVPAMTAATGPVISAVNVGIPSGTTLAIRVNQTINVKTWRAGDHFSGEVARDVVQDGHAVIPRGTPVEGRVDASHRRGHFKGRSILELRLISMRLNGTSYSLDTRENVRTKKGKGKRSAAFIGSGAGLGMLVGGVASGGVGLLVGGLAGGGLGTALGGLTGNRDIVIPAESVVDFRLADDLVVQPM